MKKARRKDSEQRADKRAELELLASLTADPELIDRLDCGRFSLEDLFDACHEQYVQLLYAVKYGDPLPPVQADPSADIVATMEALTALAAGREARGTLRDGGLRAALAGLYRFRVARMEEETRTQGIRFFTSLAKEIGSMRSDEEFRARFNHKGDGGKPNEEVKGAWVYRDRCPGNDTPRGQKGDVSPPVLIGLGVNDDGTVNLWDGDRVVTRPPLMPGADQPSPLFEGCSLVAQVEIDPYLKAIEVGNAALVHELRKVFAQGPRAFTRAPGSNWPTADLTNSRKTLRAAAQIKPDVEDVAFLSPEEIAKWQPIISARVKKLDDITADCLDIILAIWLRSAKHPTDVVTVKADDFLELRGLKKHLSGGGRRGGYGVELRKEIAGQLQALKTTYLVVQEMEVTETVSGKRGKYSRRKSVTMESPVIVITGRGGQATMAGDVEPFVWNVRPGDVFANFLFGAGRETALISRKALEYDPYRQKWEKRLTRYFSYLWRVRQAKGTYSEPVCIKTILDELNLASELRPDRVQERLEKALDILRADGVVASWQYEEGTDIGSFGGKKGWFACWLQSRITVEPPPQVAAHYEGIVAPVRVKSVSQDVNIDVDVIREVRSLLGLSISKAATEIGINKGTLSRIEGRKVKHFDNDTAVKLSAWLDRNRSAEQ